MYGIYGHYASPCSGYDTGYWGNGIYPTRSQVSQRDETSYIENILRLNLGKIVTLYLTYENNRDWNAKVVTGTLMAAGRDYLILRDRETGRDYLFRMVNVDFFYFEEIAYIPPEQQRRRR